jgi:predicted  nucleic acid-binding Zn-ribbon protein
MGKCYSRNDSVRKEDETAKGDEVKNNSTEAAKCKNEQTANGQVENADEANANETAASKKESSLKDKKGKTNKESKTVRITETTTSEVQTETTVLEEKSEQNSDDLPKPTQVIK